MQTERCMWCKGTFSRIDGPTHEYMESTAGCWAAFGRVLEREYTNRELFDVHRLTVDSYAVQHPGKPTRQAIQSVGVHLIRLCLLLERGLDPAKANDAMLRAAKQKASFHWLEPPDSLGEVTVADVADAESLSAHEAMVRRWADSTWAAWSAHHDVVREWASRADHR